MLGYLHASYQLMPNTKQPYDSYIKLACFLLISSDGYHTRSLRMSQYVFQGRRIVHLLNSGKIEEYKYQTQA